MKITQIEAIPVKVPYHEGHRRDDGRAESVPREYRL